MPVSRGFCSHRQRSGHALCEALEPRWLLASSDPLDLKHGPLRKVGAELAAAWRDNRGTNSRIAIEAFTSGPVSAFAANVRLLGATRVIPFANGISALVPISKIRALAKLPTLTLARPVSFITHAGSATSQSDIALGADIARGAYNLSGAGVKVGVLSDSFDTGPGSYAADVASGDLPAGVQILQDSSGADEGRAMAQIIFDSAPGVSLAFATASNGQSVFANNIKALRDAGAKVIVDDITYINEPMFQDGIVAQAVDDVVSTGVSYFAAAGNKSLQAWDSPFAAGQSRAQNSIAGSGLLTFWGGLTHDFDPGASLDDMQELTLSNNQRIALSFQWDEPYGTIPGSASCSNDMDIYLLNQAGTQVLASSSNLNTGPAGEPIEILQYTNTGPSQSFQLMIVKFAGAQPGLMKYVNYDAHTTTEWNTPPAGALFGHAAAAGAASVAAAAYSATPAFGTDPAVVEGYSSHGSTPILFSPTGVRLGSPVTRSAPLITAPDGGNTTFFGQDDNDADSFPNFYGTSAAAPAAAAAAALILQHSPALTPAQVYSAMTTTAGDMDIAGYDVATGYGLVRADAAIVSLSITFSGTASNDDYLVRRDPNDSSTLQLLVSNAVTHTAPVASIPSLTFNLLDGNDTLTLASSFPFSIAFSLGTNPTDQDTLNLSAGSLTFNRDLSSTTAHLTLNVSAGAGATFNTTQHLEALNLSAASASLSSGMNKSLVLKTLSITSSGVLDISDNALVIDYSPTDPSPLPTIKSHILTGRGGTDFANAPWTGPGIRSSTAAASDGVSFAVGYVENSLLPTLGLASYTSFFGQAVDSSSLLVRYTLGSDANLDGKTNTDDVTVVGALYNNAGSGEWYFGDFDYEGICDTDDVTVLGAQYGVIL